MKTLGLSQALLGSLSQALFRVGTHPTTHQPTGKVSSSHFKGKVSKAKLFMMIS